MMKKCFILFTVIVQLSIISGACKKDAASSWGQNFPVSTVDKSQQYPYVISDDTGHAIIVWTDYRSSYADIYAQKVNKNMTSLWQKDGIPVSSAEYGQVAPRMCPDGAGGIIIAWEDERNSQDSSSFDIYAQKINSDANAVWVVDGIAITNKTGNQAYHAITSDGSGGAIIAWADKSDGDENTSIYVQKISSSGDAVWTEGGVNISTVLSNKFNLEIVSDGLGGAIIAWLDKRNEESVSNADIYAQRIDENGTRQWDDNDVAITIAEMDQWNHKVVPDGEAGAVISWWDSNGSDIYAQRIDANGTLQWDSGGLPVAKTDRSQEAPQIIADGSGNVIIVWQDYRNGEDNDIYAQKIDINGNPQWTVNGILVSDDDRSQWNPRLASDGSSGAIITWETEGNSYDVYAQRIDGNGNLLWNNSGVAISTEEESQWGPEIAVLSDLSGAVIVWTDFRNDETILGRDIFADFIGID